MTDDVLFTATNDGARLVVRDQGVELHTAGEVLVVRRDDLAAATAEGGVLSVYGTEEHPTLTFFTDPETADNARVEIIALLM